MYSVLYVDDEPELLEIARAFLEESREFAIDTKSSAKDALGALRQVRYDAIVSDFLMPDMNGISFLKEVRSSFGDIPFIVFTGRGREEVAIQALNNGADFYLQKGGDPEAAYMELMHMMRRAIRMRETQATLAEQEQRYHDLQNATDMIQSVTPEGRFLFVNTKWQDTLGYREDELSGITLFDIIHEESREHCKILFPRVIAGENVGIIDVVFRARDGRKVYAEGFASCKISDGKPQYTRGIFQDVTDRKKTEAALKESEEKFRTLVEFTLDGILILDTTGAILFANQAAGQIVGIQNFRELFGTRNVTDFIHPDSRKDVARDFEQVATGTDGYLAQYKIVTVQHRERWVESIGKGIVFEGRPAIFISLRDITDRKQADIVLKESESRFRTIFENSPYPIAINSMPDMKFIAVNPVFLKVSGYTEEEVVGKTPVELRLIPLTEATRLISRAVLAGKIENVPLSLSVKDGKMAQVLFSTIPVTINNQAASLTVTIEVTNVKKIEGELIQKNAELSTAYEQLAATEEELRQNYEELSRQERALRMSEEKYRLMTEVTSDIIYMIDPEGRITYISPQVSRYGYEPAEILSRRFTDFISEESQESAAADLKRVLSTRKTTVSSLWIRDKSGNRRWMEYSSGPIFDASGGVLAISGILRDVTERMLAEAALAESEEKFRALVETSPDVIWEIDLQGTIRYISPMVKSLMGYSPKEMVGKSLADVVAKEARPRLMQEMSRIVAAEGAIPPMQYPAYHRDGHVFIVEIRAARHVDHDGNLDGFRGIAVDITERRKAEDALRESEEKFRALVEHSLDGTLIVDMSGNVLFMNRAMAKILGREDSMPPATPVNVTEFLSPEGKDEVIKDIGNVEQGIEGYPMQYLVTTASGSQVWVESIGTKILYQNIPASLVSVRDISTRKQMEEAILRTNRQLSLLSSITRHDVLNKIAFIQGHIALARMKGMPPDCPALLEKIETTTNVIKSQVEFTRIYQNLGTKKPEWQRPEKFLSASHLPKSVELKNDLGRVEIYADLMLEKVFQNLADNAIRHGGSVTEIRMGSREDGSGLTIVFEDNGTGIPEEEKERIFERGYGKNTGLGLFLAREILGITGMEIRETGVAGKGARFEIHVPTGAYRRAPV